MDGGERGNMQDKRDVNEEEETGGDVPRRASEAPLGVDFAVGVKHDSMCMESFSLWWLRGKLVFALLLSTVLGSHSVSPQNCKPLFSLSFGE